jgi:hypothetical protein
MAALGADAGPAGTARKGSAPAAASLSAAAALSTTAAPPAAAVHSTSIAFIHETFLLSETVKAMKAAVSPPPATGHRKDAVLKLPGQPGPEDLPQIAGDEGDHPDAVGYNHGVQGAGYGAANQLLDAKLGKPDRLHCVRLLRQALVLRPDDASGFGLDQTDLPGHVEDRRDPVIPDWKCRSHG